MKRLLAFIMIVLMTMVTVGAGYAPKDEMSGLPADAAEKGITEETEAFSEEMTDDNSDEMAGFLPENAAEVRHEESAEVMSEESVNEYQDELTDSLMKDSAEPTTETLLEKAEASLESAETPLEQAAATSGSCGASAKWKYSASDKTLTIYGSGAMDDYSGSGSTPWSAYKSEIEIVKVEEGITYLGNKAFSYLNSLTSASVAEGVTYVGNTVFGYCNNLETVALPEGLTVIGDDMFVYCFNLKDINIPEGVTRIGSRAFLSDMDIEEMTLPKSLREVGMYAFSGCVRLKNLIFHKNVNKIETYAFSGCTGLESAVFMCDPPLFEENCFSGAKKIQGYHALENEKWTGDVCKSYGGKITWNTYSYPEVEGVWPENGMEFYDHGLQECRIQFKEDITMWDDGYALLYDCDHPGEPVEKTRITIDGEEQGKCFVLNCKINGELKPDCILRITFETPLISGHEYMVSLDENVLGQTVYNSTLGRDVKIGPYSKAIAKEEWRFKTISTDYMHFKNIKEKIDDRIYKAIFPNPITRSWIKGKDSGEDGTCFGWSFAVGAFEKGFSGIKSIAQSLSKADQTQLEDYIFAVHLSQYTKEKSKERKKCGMDQLYAAIQEHLNGGTKIIINVHEKNAEDPQTGEKTGQKGHALYPVRILEETDTEMKLLVIDCNKPAMIQDEFGFSEGTAESFANRYRPIIFTKTNGEITGFSYLERYSDSIDFNTIDAETETECLAEKNTVEKAEKNAEKEYMLRASEPVQAESLTEILSVTGESGNTDYLYWADEESYSCSDAGLFAMTDGWHGVEINSISGAAAKVDIANRSATVAADGTAGAFSFTFTDYEENGTSRTIEAGAETAATFSMENTEEGFYISGTDVENITLTMENKTAEVDLPEDKTLILVEDDAVTVYIDPDGDGVYDTKAGESEWVAPVAVSGITMESSVEVPAGKTLSLGAKVQPLDAANQNITYTSANPKIATVDENGTVKGVSQGRTSITAVTEDGGFTAKCDVFVQFSDVTNKKLAAYNAIYSLADKGVVKGYGSYFDIDGKCTRAQFVLFLWRLAGQPAAKSKTLTFKDAADIEALAPSYKKAILWGSEKGIVMGFTAGANKGKFLPNDPCTRGQVVTFLWRYAGQKPAKAGAKTFPDVPKTHKYYKAIMWASSYGITTGFGDGKFKPDQNCTRGQCVTFLYRM